MCSSCQELSKELRSDDDNRKQEIVLKTLKVSRQSMNHHMLGEFVHKECCIHVCVCVQFMLRQWAKELNERPMEVKRSYQVCRKPWTIVLRLAF